MEEEGARRHPRLGGGADLISALPEDLLLHVLRRLGCARAAARTSLLSRPWRGLWTRLPDLIFRDIPVRSILSALRLSSLQHSGVSLLDITFTSPEAAAGLSLPGPGLGEKLAAGVPSLLHAAAGLSPAEFQFVLPISLERADADLPSFHRTTSIQVYAYNLRLTLPRSSGAFPRLQKLTLSGCSVDVTALVLCCPCLLVLRVNEASVEASINIRSQSLQKLSVRTKRKHHMWTDRINVEAPMLEQLAVSISSGTDISVSVVAPLLEKVSWECFYDKTIAGLACWGLSKVRVCPAQSLGQRRVVTCLQLSNAYVLSLQVSCCDWFKSELDFVRHIEKHLVTDFSILDLTMGCYYDRAPGFVGHVFGPFLLRLLGMHRIRTATRRLQIHFPRPEVKGRCPVNCLYAEPNWTSKNISLINLEEVEIDGFDGEDHAFDFLKVIFRCAPMLKRMAIRTSHEVRTSDYQSTKIQDIFKTYPFVECKLIQR